MKLPNAAQATVTEEKITRYLLSDMQRDGRHKAAFFRQFGFALERWAELAQALKAHASAHEVAHVRDSPFGIRYTIEGPLATPSGRSPMLRSVWVIESGMETPRLVSAYPLAPRRP